MEIKIINIEHQIIAQHVRRTIKIKMTTIFCASANYLRT